MSYNRFYQAPDYAKKLGEIYARQSRQLDEDLKNKLEQSQQIAAADPDVTRLQVPKATLDVVQKLAPLAGKVAKGLSDKAKKDKQKRLQAEWDDKSGSEKEAILKGFEIKERGLKVDDDIGREELRKDIEKRFGKKYEDFNPEQKTYTDETLRAFDGLSGSNYLDHLQHTARSQLSIMTDKYVRAEILKDPKTSGQYALTPDGIIKGSEVNRWRREKMNSLGYSDGILAKLEKETTRKSSTTSTLSKAKTIATANSVRDNKFLDEFTTATKVQGQNIGQFAHDWLQKNVGFYYEKDGQTAQQQATAAFSSHMYKLGETGDLTRDAWTDLKTSGIVSAFPDPNNKGEVILKAPPSGDTFGKVYLDKNGDIDRHVLRGIKKGENLSIKEQQAIGDGYYARISNGLRTGKIEHGTTAYTTAIARLNGMQLTNFDAKMKALERIATNDQSKEAYEAEMLKYDTAINKGTLYETKTLAEIKLIGNIQARTELEALAKKQQHAATQGNLKDQMTGIENDVKKGRTGPFGLKGLTGPAIDVRNDIQAFYRRDYFRRVALAGDNPDYLTIATEATIATEKYKADNGWGIELGRDGSGKFSVKGTDGEYSNYRQSLEITTNPGYKSQTAKWSTANGNGWNKTHLAKIERYGADPAIRYKKVGGIFSDEQLAYFAKTGKISAEMRYIASREGENISRLLGFAINAVVDDKDSQRFSENYNFEKIATAKGSDEIILEKSYNKIELLKTAKKEAEARRESVLDLETLTSRAKRFGFDSLTGNQAQRLLVHLGETSQPSAESQRHAALIRNQELKDLKLKKEAEAFGKTTAGIAANELGNK